MRRTLLIGISCLCVTFTAMADNTTSETTGQNPPVANVAAVQGTASSTLPAQITNTTTNQGAMVLTQPTLGPSASAINSTSSGNDTTNSAVASSWETLENANQTNQTPDNQITQQTTTPTLQTQESGSDETTDNNESVTTSNNFTPDDEGDEHVIWNKRPVNFVVPVGKERMISFPDEIAFADSSPPLTSDQLKIIGNAGTLYIKALQIFPSTLMSVHLKNSGQQVLIDISSAEAADDTPVDVVMADLPNNTSASSPAGNSSLSYVDLLRFAIQELYSPQRLIIQPADIARTPMFTQKQVSLLYGNNTEAFPESSWRGGNDFVTAVVIKNTQSHSVTLDPRNLHGQWLASAFYPTNVLAPRGRHGDETTLFVISDRPFGEALAVTAEGEA